MFVVTTLSLFWNQLYIETFVNHTNTLLSEVCDVVCIGATNPDICTSVRLVKKICKTTNKPIKLSMSANWLLMFKFTRQTRVC